MLILTHQEWLRRPALKIMMPIVEKTKILKFRRVIPQASARWKVRKSNVSKYISWSCKTFSDITLSCPTQHKWTFLEAFWLPNSILIRNLHFCDIEFIQVGSDDDHYCWLWPQPKDFFRFIVNFMRIDKKISFWRENSWRVLRSFGGLHSYPPHSYCGELDKSTT